MKELIDKAAVVEEIEKLKAYLQIPNAQLEAIQVCDNVISVINTLEVKEVDLDESARHYLLHEHISPLNKVLHQADLKVEMQYHKDIEDAYKAGFELGLKAKKGE